MPGELRKNNDIGSGLDEMDYYRGLEHIWGAPGEFSNRIEVREGGDLSGTDISLHRPIIVGKFVDRGRHTFLDNYRAASAARGKTP